MLTTLLTVLLATPAPGASVWRFPNPDSDALKAAVVEARGDDPMNRVTAEEIEALFAEPAALTGCLVDARPCDDVGLDALGVYGVSSRIDATARMEGAQHQVKLVIMPVVGGKAQTVTARGETLLAAVSAALAAHRGQSTIRVAVKPPEASVLIDGVRVGQGDGVYPAAPGKRVVRVEAAGFASLEQTAIVEVGKGEVLTFEMASAGGELILAILPETATVELDGKPIEWKAPLKIEPGTYSIVVKATDHVTHEQKLTIKQGVRHDLKVTLPPRAPTWQEALSSPHPDTVAHNGYFRADVRFASIFDGPLDLASGRDAERVRLETQDDSIGLLGLDLGAGWRHRYWFVEPLGLSIDAGGSTRSVTMDVGEGAIENLTRIGLRPAWVGARYPAWRLDPYVAAGFVVVFESFDLVVGEDTRAVDNRMFEFGVEFGLRFAVTADWFVSAAGRFDFWFDERTSGAVLLGGGWALDFPEWL